MTQRRWAQGWRRVVFPAVFLVWLVEVGAAVPSHNGVAGLVAGEADLAVFGAVYLLTVHEQWTAEEGRLRWLLAALVVLLVVELPFARADTFVMAAYVSTVIVVRYGGLAVPAVAAFTALAAFLPPAVPSWHDSLDTGLNNGTVLAIPIIGLAMYGFGQVIRGNGALADARAEVARLAAENERTRIARDLHDLLGHSLTTIAVKAELAHRLADADPDAARREVGEVASLSRRALRDVRAAVSNYREVTLAGELASGREILRAAGIAAELPPAADVVDEGTQELFGWVLREGLTNVVRHSHARSCRVRISSRSVEVVDDGLGPSQREGSSPHGSGLQGLTERVACAGGVLEAGPVESGGWRLAVHLEDAAP